MTGKHVNPEQTSSSKTASSSMIPEAEKNKHVETSWESLKKELSHLYLREDVPLNQLMVRMGEQYDFHAR